MPFRNLKLLIILNKALGLFSCKLVNGQLKSSSVWSCCFCMMWALFHCSYMGVFYYNMSIASLTEKADNFFVFNIVRASGFFISLIPYNVAAAFWSEDFVKLSDKFVMYDEQAIALGHQRKDKHVFPYLFFVYTFTTTSFKFYYELSNAMLKETIDISNLLLIVVPTIAGAYCVLVTCIFLDLIRQRFRHLNETIIPHVSALPVTGSRDEITVYDVRYLHGLLLNCAQVINSLYGIGTLFTFLSILLEIIASLYILIKELQKNNDIHDNCIQMMDLLFQTIFLVAMYHFTTYEANRVEERVIKYGLSISSERCRMDKIEMMLYFYHKRYSFTAAEFFPLDMTIFIPITTAIITYLTLLV